MSNRLNRSKAFDALFSIIMALVIPAILTLILIPASYGQIEGVASPKVPDSDGSESAESAESALEPKPSKSLTDQLSQLSQLSQPSKLKSSNQAFLFSALVPGTGELYSEAKRGYVFLLAEGVFWAGFFIKNRKFHEVQDQYVAYVKDHVKFDGKYGGGSFDTWNMEDFEHSTLYDNWRNVYTEEEEKPKASVGAFYWEDDDFKDRSDEKPESEKRGEALKLRQDSNKIHKTATAFIGLAIFNHVISAIDARIAAKLYNGKLQKSKVSFQIDSNSGEIREEIRVALFNF